ILTPERQKIVKMFYGICTCPEDLEFVSDKKMRYNDIAEILNLPVTRIKSELNAALSQFRTSSVFSDKYEKMCFRSRRDLDRIDIDQPTHESMMSEMEATSAAILEFSENGEINLEAAFGI